MSGADHPSKLAENAMSRSLAAAPTPLTYPRPPALIAEYWKVVAHERQKMFRAWAAWLDQRPNPEHVETEIAATESVLRQMVRLRDKVASEVGTAAKVKV